jgi:putative transposase
MPRTARIDLPGLLQHVMARGIEGRNIFEDLRDREAFLERLSETLRKGQAQLLAWSLMSNHFHLLLRPGARVLSSLMRHLRIGDVIDWRDKTK